MKSIPQEAKAYKKTPTFDEKSVPNGLLKDHQTKAGVWGKIQILEGELLYTIQSTPPETCLLNAQNPGVVEPEIPHHVEPKGKVQFYVEFYK